jgi:ferredoxin
MSEANALFSSRDMDLLSHRELEPSQWVRALRAATEQSAARMIDRRSFFRSAIDAPRERLRAVIDEASDGFKAVGELLPDTRGKSALYPFVPDIDPERCNGCNTCARLCPQGAIRLDEGESESLYLIDARRCSNCRICVDVCDQGAVAIGHFVPGGRRSILLTRSRCRACGVNYHQPDSRSGTDHLCPICVKTNHHQRLFQVLD